MTRRTMALVALCCAAVGAAPLSAPAQEAGKPRRIGYLSVDAGNYRPRVQYRVDAFLHGLRELGWIEGRTIAIEYRWGSFDRLPELAAELVGLKVEVIVTGSDGATRAARQATNTVPIVMAIGGDPVALGFAKSLQRPGGNITGLSLLANDLGSKRLQLLKEVVPHTQRIAVLWNAAYPGKELELQQTEIGARALGVTLLPMAVRGPADFAEAFTAIAKARPDALIVAAEPLTLGHQQPIADFAARNRLPMISEIKEFAEAGGLMTYGASPSDLHRLAAAYVDKILKGAVPGELPVEQAAIFELVVNLKTAKALGLTIPSSVLVRADEVIE